MGASASALNRIFQSQRIRPLYFKAVTLSVKNSDKDGLKMIDKAIRIEEITRNNRDVLAELGVLKAGLCVKLERFDDAMKITTTELKHWPRSFRLNFLRKNLEVIKEMKGKSN